MFLTAGPLGPCVEVAWTPTPETGVRVYLRLAEAEELADALTAALITHARFSAEGNGNGSKPNWMPSGAPDWPDPEYGPSTGPRGGEF
ncbi:hypothetical protein [Nocardia seriolae]|uniref:Uncharacterized protein n=1 Tax=Nocardia seriolae TaxID=37332 RepID=A0A0B8NMD8_9NOCA|nr:hypothetical protein [Nocardia seriolae]APA97081.1 hypothetical protein NS506_03024 [Nocardia seriolae]MTJ65120.1 hypothetical protein [Nocardia seriolae]MTJ76514.1 hypothetical protein [Nocardia seriolae]MTJ86956.1 hypothetical protein [Nocardia seriolae]MTK30951.1 hypothetical protein [Nocardia seriolae]